LGMLDRLCSIQAVLLKSTACTAPRLYPTCKIHSSVNIAKVAGESSATVLNRQEDRRGVCMP
jgi:hypothetical protein